MRIDGRVADENVNVSPGLARLGDQVLELRLVRNARGNRQRLTAIGADCRRHLLARRKVAGRDHDAAAGCGKGLGDRPADAARGAGHDRHPPG